MKFRDYEKYEIFDDGRIWSYSQKKFLKPSTRKDGYQVVCLYDNEGNVKQYLLHRVVYESVTGKPIPKCMQVNHIDENKENNARSNLNLMSPKQNTNWGTGIERSHKTQSKQVGAFKDGNLVMIFASTNDAGRQGFNQGAVAACCRNCFNREGNNMYRGFEWKFI